MINRLVLENIKHRPVRTLLTAVAIGFGVTLILTLVGVSRGMLEGMQARNRGTGADIIIRPPDSSVIGFGSSMTEKLVDLVRKEPHVTQATGALVHPVGMLDSVTGIDPDEFAQLNGGLVYIEGKPFETPDDLVVDRVFAKSKKVGVGDTLKMGPDWHISGIVEEGKLSRAFTNIRTLQERFSETGKVSMILVKVDDPKQTPAIVNALRVRLDGYKIYAMEEFLSLFTVDSVPMVKEFTGVVIAIGALFGFLMVLLSMYTAVLERTREIGILKALGASPAYILGILMRETIAMALVGTLLGIGMTYGTRAVMAAFVPTMPQVLVPDWYPIVTVVSIVGAVIGAVYPGMRAARQDAIEALAYD